MSEEYYLSRHLNHKDIKDPTKDFVSCSTDSIHSLTKEKLALCKDDVQKNTLSDEEFHRYFEWELMQKNIGNCYLLAVINSLRLHTDFKKLIQKSVKKIPDGFEFILPLGAPYPYGKIIKVTKRDYYPQLTIGGNELMVLDGNEWLKALAIAYGNISTGQSEYDTQLLTGWDEVNVMNTMFYWISGYSRSRKMFNFTDNNTKISWNKKEDIEFVNELGNVLSMFDTNKLMTVSIPINESGAVDDVFDFRKYPEYAYERDHAFTVQSVEKIWNNIRSVTIINPWDSTKHIKIPVEKFLRLVTSYSFGSYNPRVFGITYTNSRDIWNRDTLDQQFYKEKKFENMWLNQVIEKYVPSLINPWSGSFIRLVQWQYFIDSYWKTDVILGAGFSDFILNNSIIMAWWFEEYFEESKKSWEWYYREKFIQFYKMSQRKKRGKEFSITFGKQTINFNNQNPFSTQFQWRTDLRFAYTLYPALFATFINQCRQVYIGKREERESTILEPFYLDAKWGLSFSDGRVSDNVDNFFTGKTYGYDIMSKWSEIWINSSDIETKKKIIDLLNRLYKWD